MSKILKEMPYNIERSERMQPFWQGLNDGQLLTTKCLKCSSLHYPPSPILCPSCFGQKMNWVNLPLTGTVSSFTWVRAPPAGFDGEYTLASVIIDELDKPILGRILGSDIVIGDDVELKFEKVGDQSLFVFQKVTS